MARLLGRIWIRFGLWIAATVLLTIGVLTVGMLLSDQVQYRSFEETLPAPIRRELKQLVDDNLEDSPRAIEIYRAYWQGWLPFGEQLSLLVGLAGCLPLGLVGGFMVSRIVTLPIGSMAATAQRIARGDLSARAEPGGKSGEMAEMVHHFNDMADSLETLERERKATAAAISHELRTPLTILTARLHAACDGVIAASEQEFRHLLGQVEHLGRLVDDLHTLSMAEAGRLTLQRTPLDLGEIARAALERHALRLEQNGIESHLAGPGSSAIVDADRDRLTQVLSNLIENASRHARAGGWLEVRISLEGRSAEFGSGAAVLTVSDAGAGLSEEARSYMFRPLSDPHPSRSAATGGSGLGLSIVHMLVAQHGGTIHAGVSERGGTRFTVRLPLLPQAPGLNRTWRENEVVA